MVNPPMHDQEKLRALTEALLAEVRRLDAEAVEKAWNVILDECDRRYVPKAAAQAGEGRRTWGRCYCEDCGWESSSYKNIPAIASRHATAHGHRVTGEVGAHFTYDARSDGLTKTKESP